MQINIKTTKSAGALLFFDDFIDFGHVFRIHVLVEKVAEGHASVRMNVINGCALNKAGSALFADDVIGGKTAHSVIHEADAFVEHVGIVDVVVSADDVYGFARFQDFGKQAAVVRAYTDTFARHAS